MSTTSKKILILEDERALSKVAANKLTAEGFEVDTLPNGNNVVEYLQKEKPDLILLDLVMPGFDGFTVLKEIKNDPSLSHIIVIVLSNLSQDTDVDTVLKLGAKEFLVKSDTPLSQVVETVKKYLA